MKRVAMFALLVAGCAGEGFAQDNDGGASDAPPGCSLTVVFDPPFPTTSSIAPIRATAKLIGAGGVVTYDWTVTHNGNVTYSYEAGDQSAIGFLAPTTGTYDVSLTVGNAPFGCDRYDVPLDVHAPNPNSGIVRLRTVASPTLAPPQETVIQIQGGGNYTHDILLDSGLPLSGLVHTNGGPGVPAYVKLMPISEPFAFTEVFTSSAGTFSARLLGQTHNVLVIPTSTALAPKLLSWGPGTTEFIVGAGTTVTGVVHDPSGAGFSGAKVQLEAGGVPSTVATTAVDGSFTLHADLPAGMLISVRVTPPGASGLPRLEASGNFDLGQSVQVTYSAALQTCSLGGNAVKRSGTNQPNAKVTIVGTLGGTPGTVTTGSTTVNATGTVHVATTANGSGVLPATLVPRSNQLSAVISLSDTDWAFDTVDTSACAAQTIDALPQTTRTGITQNVNGVALGGVRIEAIPVGILALGDAQPIVVSASSSGAFSIDLAAGGAYDVHFTDPLARAAPLPLMSIAPSGVPTTATLGKSLVISGDVTVSGSANKPDGASVQILCSSCSGIEAARPISQTATDSAGHYRIAVPDPGVM